MDQQLVTVFGGTGFLGRRVTRHLRDKGFHIRVASRHSERAAKLFGTEDSRIQSIAADVHNEAAVTKATSGAWGVVNAVSLYTEQGSETFKSVHVEAARRVAMSARSNGVERLVHVSGIGANPRSSSSYIRSRGLGELAVQEALGDVTLIRPEMLTRITTDKSLSKGQKAKWIKVIRTVTTARLLDRETAIISV